MVFGNWYENALGNLKDKQDKVTLNKKREHLTILIAMFTSERLKKKKKEVRLTKKENSKA